MFELCRDDGYKLGIGLDGAIGCVQFMRVDHEPPYLMALAAPLLMQSSHSFPMNGHVTEVASKHCVSADTVVQIACHFFETGERSPLVTWEEV